MKYPPFSSKPPVRRKSGIIVRDVLLVLISLLGLGGAAALIYRDTRSPNYETQAKLLVRYVLERSAVDPYESKVDAGGNRGMEVMDAEIEIIKSADVALEVATKIGPEKILTETKIPADQAARRSADRQEPRRPDGARQQCHPPRLPPFGSRRWRSPCSNS